MVGPPGNAQIMAKRFMGTSRQNDEVIEVYEDLNIGGVVVEIQCVSILRAMDAYHMTHEKEVGLNRKAKHCKSSRHCYFMTALFMKTAPISTE